MNILLIDIDGKLPNLALMKISSYHKAQGNNVYLNNCYKKPDKVYISTLFTWNRSKIENLLQMYPNAEVGGTGWDLSKALPKEIEQCKPDYELYQWQDIFQKISKGIRRKSTTIEKAESIVNAGIGRTSKGCIRDCGFCVVPKIEGKFQQVADLEELINPKSNLVILLDNNLTVDPDCINKLNYARDRKLILDITQGIDIRLMTPDIAQSLAEVKHYGSIHYSWDTMDSERKIVQGIKILGEKIALYKHRCYMLVGYNTTFEEDMYRVRRLIEMKIRPYVMTYNNQTFDRRIRHFARWINGFFYTKCSFEEYEPWIKEQDNKQLEIML